MSEKTAARRGAVGFQGGQVLSIRVPEAELEKLRTALREGKERWHEVAAADGAVLAHGLRERLRVEPAPRLRIGREGDAHGA